jgi:hypothetical protein
VADDRVEGHKALSLGIGIGEQANQLPTPNSQLPRRMQGTLGVGVLGVGSWKLGVGNWDLGIGVSRIKMLFIPDPGSPITTELPSKDSSPEPALLLGGRFRQGRQRW